MPSAFNNYENRLLKTGLNGSPFKSLGGGPFNPLSINLLSENPLTCNPFAPRDNRFANPILNQEIFNMGQNSMPNFGNINPEMLQKLLQGLNNHQH